MRAWLLRPGARDRRRVDPPHSLKVETAAMAAKDRLSVLLAMMDQGVIPVFYDPDVEVCKNVIQACANGGAKCIEFTNRGDFAVARLLEVTRHFAKADPSRDHGRRLRRRCADRGDLHRQRREVRRRPAPQRRRREGLQPPRHPLQPRLRLGQRDRLRPGARLRDRQGVPRLARSAAPIREERAWRRCRGRASCPPAASKPTEESLAQVVRRRHRRLRHRQQPRSPRSCSTRRTTRASRRSVRTTVQLVKTIKADLAAKR